MTTMTTMSGAAPAAGTKHTSNVALYWDFENLHGSLFDDIHGNGAYAHHRYKPQDELIDIGVIIDFAAAHGSLAINRAFGNWCSFFRYRNTLLQSATELVQVFGAGANGKNGADIKLALDVLDDMTRHAHIDTVIVVGADSDYMPLSHKVKAAGRRLVGIGARASTNLHWARSCHQFVYYDDLVPPHGGAQAPDVDQPQPGASGPDDGPLGTGLLAAPTAADESVGSDARALVSHALRHLSQRRGDPWVPKAALRPCMQRLDSTIGDQAHVVGNLNDLLASMPDLVEVRRGVFDHEVRLRAA